MAAIGLIDRPAACSQDHRDPRRIEHTVRTLLGQRVIGLPASGGVLHRLRCADGGGTPSRTPRTRHPPLSQPSIRTRAVPWPAAPEKCLAISEMALAASAYDAAGADPSPLRRARGCQRCGLVVALADVAAHRNDAVGIEAGRPRNLPWNQHCNSPSTCFSAANRTSRASRSSTSRTSSRAALMIITAWRQRQAESCVPRT